jgi:periplasmic divalent cation tolerance protein
LSHQRTMDPSNPLVVVFSTVPNRETGLRIGRTLVEQRLIACANLVPGLTSVYRWDGEVREEDEVLLLMKTRQTRLAELTERLTALHPFEVPELLAVPVEAGLPAYCAWVVAETAGDGA